ncbi:MAG: TolC family protein [Rikenellaceae bacterium]|nr:TolC family protein [Rikenellaceae bacterium]
MRRRTIYIISGLALLTLPALGQRTISLDEYRAAVADHSYQLKMAAEEATAALATQRQQQTGFLPRLDAVGNFSLNFREQRTAAGAYIQPYSFFLQPAIVQNVYLGGTVRNQVGQARLGYEMAVNDQELTRSNIDYLAEYTYWNLAANDELVKATRQYINIIRTLQNVIKLRFDDGYVGKTDLLMIEARLSEATYDMVSAETKYKVALHNFNVLMGAPVDSAVRVSDEILRRVAMPSRIGREEAIGRRPDFQKALKQVDFNAYGTKLAAGRFNPQVTFGVQGGWNTLTPNLRGDTRIDGLAYVQLNIPIFAWGERRHAVAASRAALRSSRYNLDQVTDDITAELSNAWTGIEESFEQVTIAFNGLKIAQENLDLSTFSYNEGAATILDVLSAQLSWLQLYTNAITSNYNYRLSIAEYRRAIGGTTGE